MNPDRASVVLVTPNGVVADPGPELSVARAVEIAAADPLTGSAHGRAWHKALPDARLEMVPNGEHDLLEQMWKRILSHCAPGRKA